MQGCYGSCLRLLAGNNLEDCIQHHSDTGLEYCTPVHKNVGNNTPDQVKKGLKFVVSRRWVAIVVIARENIADVPRAQSSYHSNER